MSSQEPTEEELRAALEEQLRNVTVDRVLIETAVTLVNLAGRRLGLGAGAEAERDLTQVRDAIDGVRALMPVLERQEGAPDIAPLREAVSQLQLEYAKLAGQEGAPAAPEPPAGPTPSETPAGEQHDTEAPGPAQSSGRLWIPGS